MQRFLIFGFALLVALGLAGFSISPVQAQTPEPTPTPTPAYIQEVPLTDGATLIIDRHISYGDIGIVVSILGLALIMLGIFFFWSPIWRR